jgi:hypothetical protein
MGGIRMLVCSCWTGRGVAVDATSHMEDGTLCIHTCRQTVEADEHTYILCSGILALPYALAYTYARRNAV